MSRVSRPLTLKGWLGQSFPVLGVREFGTSSSHGVSLRQALTLGRWEGLSDSVRDYIDQSDDTNANLAPLTRAVLGMLRLDYINESSASNAFQHLLQLFQDPLERDFFLRTGMPPTTSLASGSGSGGIPELADSRIAVLAESPSRWYTDIIVSLKEDFSDPVLVVEVKRPAVFRANPDSGIPILWSLAATTAGRNSSAADRVRLDAVRQLHEYMDCLDLKYGILSSFDVMYVACRLENCAEETLLISDGIARSDQYFLATLAYILSKTLYEPAVFKRPEQKVNVPASAPGSSTAPGSEDVKLKRKVPEAWEKRLCPRGALRETPAEHLHLARRHFATGWSGKIVRGTYEGQSVVVKLAPVGSKRGEALLTEVEAYHMLKEVWGKYVPRLVSYGTTGGGSIVYIATEEIMGQEIGMGPLSQAVVEEIFNALAVVHQCGILHGDIRPNNILVTNGGQAGVRFLDFGFACFDSSDVDRKRECAQLESLMSEFTCLDVTSQFQLEQRQEV